MPFMTREQSLHFWNLSEDYWQIHVFLNILFLYYLTDTVLNYLFYKSVLNSVLNIWTNVPQSNQPNRNQFLPDELTITKLFFHLHSLMVGF